MFRNINSRCWVWRLNFLPATRCLIHSSYPTAPDSISSSFLGGQLSNFIPRLSPISERISLISLRDFLQNSLLPNFGLCLLNQVPDQLDISMFQTIGRADRKFQFIYTAGRGFHLIFGCQDALLRFPFPLLLPPLLQR